MCKVHHDTHYDILSATYTLLRFCPINKLYVTYFLVMLEK